MVRLVLGTSMKECTNKEDFMGTFVFKRTCPNCNTVCRIACSKSIERDKDSIDCPICRTTVYEWDDYEYSILVGYDK